MEQEALVKFMNTVELLGYIVIFYFFVTRRGEVENVFAKIGDEVAAQIYKFFRKEGK